MNPRRTRGIQSDFQPIIKFSKFLTSVIFTLHRVFFFVCTHLVRNWLPARPAVDGATFMNEFAPQRDASSASHQEAHSSKVYSN